MTMQFLSPNSTVIGALPLVQRQGKTGKFLDFSTQNGKKQWTLTAVNISKYCTCVWNLHREGILQNCSLLERCYVGWGHCRQSYIKWSEVRMLVTQSCPTLCNPMDYIPLDSSVRGINSPGTNTRVDRHSLLQGIFLTQGSNLSPLHAGRFFTIWATRDPEVIPNRQPNQWEKLLSVFHKNYVLSDFCPVSTVLLRPLGWNLSPVSLVGVLSYSHCHCSIQDLVT